MAGHDPAIYPLAGIKPRHDVHMCPLR